MVTYRTVYNQKIYNDLVNFLKGKKKDLEFKCVSNFNFTCKDGIVCWDTPYNMILFERENENVLQFTVQLTIYDNERTEKADFEIFRISFDNCIHIETMQGSDIEIFSTKEMEKQFEGIIEFKE